MSAAKANSEEGLRLLLRNDADPNAIVLINKFGKDDEDISSREDEDYEGYTALTLAIEAENPDLATTLMEVTNAGMNISFDRLAESAIDWSRNEANFNNFKSMIKKKLENENSLFEGFFKSAVVHGNKTWVNFLRSEFPDLIKKLSDEQKEKLLEDAVYSDDGGVCQELAEDENFHVNDEMRRLAVSCGKTDVIKAFGAEATSEDKMEGILVDQMIKSEEFEYTDNIGKLIKEFLNNLDTNKSRIIVDMDEMVDDKFFNHSFKQSS